MSILIENLRGIQTARDNMQNAFANKGVIVTKDIRTYANAIANIPSGSGSGDVKLFDTVEHMQADPNPSEGDLAVVYREELTAVTAESEFDSCTFPNTVVLDEAFSGEIYGSFRAVDQSVMFDGMMEMSSTAFRFDGYGDSGEIRVEYESEDGITYTRTDSGEELQEFGVVIKWQDYGEEFNSVIGNFMKIGGNYFDGLYNYKCNHTNYNKRIILSLNNFTITDSTIEYNTEAEQVTLDYDKFLKLVGKIGDDISYTYCSAILCVDTNNVFHIIATMVEDVTSRVLFTSGLTEPRPIIKKTSEVEGSTSFLDFTFDSSLTSYTKSQITFNTIRVEDGSSSSVYWYYCPTLQLATIPQYMVIRQSINEQLKDCMPSEFNVEFNKLNSSNQAEFFIKYEDDNIWLKENLYLPIQSQLDATSDYVYEKTFLGKNGTEIGSLGLTTNLSKNDIKLKSDIYSHLYHLSTNEKSLASLFHSDTSLVTIPLINTSNTTHMGYMFAYCNNLVSVPLLDTSNVVSMSGMFSFCSNLVKVPNFNTINVTNTYFMFGGCANLTNIPMMDTSNVTVMDQMFSRCSSITEIPTLNTSKNATLTFMFSGCSSLVNIPLLNTSNVTNMYKMVNGCENLSDNSLNNILAMCVSSNVSNNKDLKYVGLTNGQATICTTLSNYQAFVNAGWTTGY